MTPGPKTSAWSKLAALVQRSPAFMVREAFKADPGRFAQFSTEQAGLLLDYSRQRVDAPTMGALLELADQVDLRAAIDAMWRGDVINRAEDRAALHVALRQPAAAAVQPGGAEIARLVLEERERMLKFAEDVRGGAVRAGGADRYRLVVNIGIGGSDLGPAMAVQALRNYGAGGPRVHFVSNVDGCDLADILGDADPATTLFVICSKTFTTQETLSNARVARAWVAQALGEREVANHFAAVSVNARAMDEFGVHADYRFAMWDWVGGRYSIWSSIGVSLAISIGAQHFRALLAGAHSIDENFRCAAWQENLPVLMALLGVWNINFLELPTLAVLPYDARLARFPAYLQQLEMESNGKSVTAEGALIDWQTAPVVWGEPGNNAQHSFFQLLHQGTPRAALDFLLPVKSSCGSQPQQDLAIANCLAQAEAFMQGQVGPEVPSQKVHAGNRPSTLLVFERLDPAALGKLIALYEHKVYAQSVLWGVNAFDQWGVELGKKMCESMIPVVRNPAAASSAAPGVRGVLPWLARWRA